MLQKIGPEIFIVIAGGPTIPAIDVANNLLKDEQETVNDSESDSPETEAKAKPIYPLVKQFGQINKVREE